MPKVINLKDKAVWTDWVDPIVRIDRQTPWGNPFIIGIHGERDTVCNAHREWLSRWIEYAEEIKMQIGAREFSNKWVVENLSILKGKDLACWCAPEWCHGDTLLKLANR